MVEEEPKSLFVNHYILFARVGIGHEPLTVGNSGIWGKRGKRLLSTSNEIIMTTTLPASLTASTPGTKAPALSRRVNPKFQYAIRRPRFWYHRNYRFTCSIRIATRWYNSKLHFIFNSCNRHRARFNEIKTIRRIKCAPPKTRFWKETFNATPADDRIHYSVTSSNSQPREEQFLFHSASYNHGCGSACKIREPFLQRVWRVTLVLCE